PLTFFLDPTASLAAIVTLSACSIIAGDIPSTLVRIPGTPSSAAYTDDAYALAQRGLHQRVLGNSLIFSVLGGLFGAVVLIIAAPSLARIATYFTTYEYFWLYVLGLSCAAIVSHGSRVKGTLALVLGLLLSTVGLSEVHSVPRFTLGQDELLTGINFIPAMIGLFGVAEVLRNVLRSGGDIDRLETPAETGLGETASQDETGAFAGVFHRMWSRPGSWLSASAIGTVIGVIPGAGADIAAWISYAVSKRFSRHPEEYGRGSLDGVIDATSANNAALAGAWIPALVFGIPGDSVTAIVIGVLLMKNVEPGPDIFVTQARLVHSLYLTFILANLLLVPLGYAAIRVGSLLVRIPRRVLMPMILLFCIVGSYAINASEFDVAVMLAMGLLGFVLDVYEVPLGPVVLGIILGGQVEQSFVQNLAKSDSLPAFFEQPLSLV
ncbi:MAG: tripartite tricarboxylate transporter permease, partial [Planctomycetaceae bacterium]